MAAEPWATSAAGRAHSPSEHTPQSSQHSLDLLPAAVYVVCPFADLFERDRGRLVEVVAVEKDVADDVAEEAGRTVMRGRGAVEKHFANRAGTTVLPEHACFGIDVAEGHAF